MPKTLSESTKELLNNLKESLQEHNFTTAFNLKNFVRGLLWKLCLENNSKKSNYCPNQKDEDESIYMAGDLDKIIDTILETSAMTDREDGENYPVWDRNSVKAEIKRVTKVLAKANVIFANNEII